MAAISCFPQVLGRLAQGEDSNHLERIRYVVSCLYSHPAQCATSKTKVFTWGSGLQGQLGHGDCSNQHLPKMVDYLNQTLAGDSIRQCSCGSFHTGCVTNNGKLFTWGRTQDNRLGHGDDRAAADQQLPKDIAALDQINIIKVFCGDTHSLAITKEGRVLSWGKNHHGQCGRTNPAAPPTASSNFSPISSSFWGSSPTGKDDPWAHRQSVAPLSVGYIDGLPSDAVIVDVCCGKLHSMALSKDGVVFVWGQGVEGELGLGELGSQTKDRATPVPLDPKNFGGKRVVQISTGLHFSAAVTDDGKLYTWGSDQYGQLGHGKESRHIATPQEVRGLSGHKVIRISCGQYHMAAVIESGEVFTWGYGRDGQLGHGERTDLSIPTRVEKVGGGNFGVSCGGGHTAILNGVSLWMTGRGRDGQLGRADKHESIVANRSEPVEVELFKSTKMTVVDASCGQEHSLAIVKEEA